MKLRSIGLIAAFGVLTALSSCEVGWSDEQRTMFINKCSEGFMLGISEELEFDKEIVEPRVIDACKCVQAKAQEKYPTAAEYKFEADENNAWMEECFDVDAILEGAME